MTSDDLFRLDNFYDTKCLVTLSEIQNFRNVDNLSGSLHTVIE